MQLQLTQTVNTGRCPIVFDEKTTGLSAVHSTCHLRTQKLACR
jgi:hypothetical protein